MLKPKAASESVVAGPIASRGARYMWSRPAVTMAPRTSDVRGSPGGHGDKRGAGRGREGTLVAFIFYLRVETPQRDMAATTLLPLHPARGEPTRIRRYG